MDQPQSGIYAEALDDLVAQNERALEIIERLPEEHRAEVAKVLYERQASSLRAFQCFAVEMAGILAILEAIMSRAPHR